MFAKDTLLIPTRAMPPIGHAPPRLFKSACASHVNPSGLHSSLQSPLANHSSPCQRYSQNLCLKPLRMYAMV